MANTQKYLNHLLQGTGITPACSEEENEAAQVIAGIFRAHGFDPEIQEFNASGSAKIVQAVLGIFVFLGVLFAGAGGILSVVGVLLALVGAVIFTIERMGTPVLSRLGTGGLSQNVIAYHKASGPLASPRNRPVVVVAHYDSPRVDFLSQEPFAKYRPLMVKVMPACMVAPVILCIVRLLPFPNGIKVFLWLAAIVAALVPLLNAVAIIANRFVLPYASGAVCNKSSVATLLGVMDDVAPYQGGEEFPEDVPFEEYFAEQVRVAEEAAAAAEAERLAKEAARQAKRGGEQASEPADNEEGLIDLEPMGETASFEGAGETAQSEPVLVEDEVGGTAVLADEEVETEATVQMEEPEPEPEPAAEPEPLVYPLVNDDGNLRFGEDVVRKLGMLPEGCVIVYETPADEPAEEEEPVFGATLDDVPAWDDEPEEISQFEYEEEEEERLDFTPESVPTVAERLRDGANRLISFVRSKTERPLPDVEEDGEIETAPVDDAEQEPSAEEQVADAAEPDGETGQTAVAEPVDEAGPEDPSGAEKTAVAEPVAGPEAEAVREPEGTLGSQPARSIETVDSLMAEISAASVPAAPRVVAPRVINVPSTVDVPGASNSVASNRSVLFDLPDPSAEPVDPFASTPDVSYQTGVSGATSRRGGQDAESFSDWLGVESNYDAKVSGREIGSWANFDDDDSWKGGATSSNGASEEELRQAVASMGDDELLGHDIWFVASGASENGNAGIEAFLDKHRDKLRGVFLINLECVGAGQIAMVATEGRERVLKGDRRIMNLVSKVSADFHHEFGSVEMSHLSTDAYAAMNRSLRSLTIAGVDANGYALSHSEADQVYNLNADNLSIVADVVTEVIRRC